MFPSQHAAPSWFHPKPAQCIHPGDNLIRRTFALIIQNGVSAHPAPAYAIVRLHSVIYIIKIVFNLSYSGRDSAHNAALVELRIKYTSLRRDFFYNWIN
jgi:hypothetical protein